MGKQRKRKIRPVCRDHWKTMRTEALAVMPLWSRPLAGIKINRMLKEKGFIQSDTECTYCRMEDASRKRNEQQ
jgi:hypothetical protein